MGIQDCELKELVLNLLLQMESELLREELSLTLCDAWQDVEDYVMESGEEINV
jgi:hypothetical protein